MERNELFFYLFLLLSCFCTRMPWNQCIYHMVRSYTKPFLARTPAKLLCGDMRWIMLNIYILLPCQIFNRKNFCIFPFICVSWEKSTKDIFTSFLTRLLLKNVLHIIPISSYLFRFILSLLLTLYLKKKGLDFLI